MKKPKAPRLVTVAVFTTITVIFWVFMGLYTLITSKPPVSVDPELLKPINPVLDQEVLGRLDGRVYFEPGQTVSPVIVDNAPEPTPEDEEEEEIAVPEEVITETASPTASLSE